MFYGSLLNKAGSGTAGTKIKKHRLKQDDARAWRDMFINYEYGGDKKMRIAAITHELSNLKLSKDSWGGLSKHMDDFDEFQLELMQLNKPMDQDMQMNMFLAGVMDERYEVAKQVCHISSCDYTKTRQSLVDVAHKSKMFNGTRARCAVRNKQNTNRRQNNKKITHYRKDGEKPPKNPQQFTEQG